MPGRSQSLMIREESHFRLALPFKKSPSNRVKGETAVNQVANSNANLPKSLMKSVHNDTCKLTIADVEHTKVVLYFISCSPAASTKYRAGPSRVEVHTQQRQNRRRPKWPKWPGRAAAALGPRPGRLHFSTAAFFSSSVEQFFRSFCRCFIRFFVPFPSTVDSSCSMFH